MFADSQIPLVYLLPLNRRKDECPDQIKDGDLDLDEREFVPNTSARTVDEGHDVWPDAGTFSRDGTRRGGFLRSG